MLTLNCKNCNKEFKVPQYRKSNAKFCSSICYWETLKGIGCFTGKKHNEKSKEKMSKAKIGIFLKKKSPTWKGGKYVGIHGYVFINIGNNSYKQEHRIVAESILQRTLSKEEKIHHINGNKRDNRKENLYLFPSENEHQKYHWRLKKFNETLQSNLF